MRDEKEASKVKQTNKAKQHSTPKAVTFPRKNELPRVGLELTTLYTPDRGLEIYIYMYMYITLEGIEFFNMLLLTRIKTYEYHSFPSQGTNSRSCQ